MKYIFLILSLILTTSLSGQNESFEELLKSAQVYFAEPLETFFKKEKVGKNSVIDFDYAHLKIVPSP